MVEQKAQEYKITVLGSVGVGKSSLCLRFTRDIFSESYEPTIEDYYRKEAMLDGRNVVFDIIDTAGQEHNLTNIDALIKQSNGYLLVYDITLKHSFVEVVEFYNRALNTMNASSLPVVLVGNKQDIEPKRAISFEDGLKLSHKWKCKFFEVSAKTKNNLEAVFYECARLIEQKRSEDNSGSCRCSVF